MSTFSFRVISERNTFSTVREKLSKMSQWPQFWDQQPFSCQSPTFYCLKMTKQWTLRSWIVPRTREKWAKIWNWLSKNEGKCLPSFTLIMRNRWAFIAITSHELLSRNAGLWPLFHFTSWEYFETSATLYHLEWGESKSSKLFEGFLFFPLR